MMRRKRDHLSTLLISLLILAILKWMAETTLRYLAVSADIIMAVTITGWGLCTVCSFLFLRNWIVAYRESYQSEEEAPDFAHDLFLLNRDRESDAHIKDITGGFRGLYWRLHIRVPKGKELTEYQHRTASHNDSHIQDVEGPYCPQDQCNMKQERTYFGKYRFRCHYCHYKMKKTASRETLMQDLRETADVQKMLEE